MIPEISFVPDPSKDQHFLTNPSTIKKMVRLSNPKPTDKILEVGAGAGTLTQHLARTRAKIIAVEVDRKLKKALDELDFKNLRVIYANVLEIIDKLSFNKIVSNTPYSICEPLLNKLVRRKFDLAVMSIPERFYKRISSNPGDDRYSILTIKANSFFLVDFKFRIPKEDFSPEPRTETVVVVLKPLKTKDYRKDPWRYLTREILLQESKKLKNSLMEALINLNKNVLGKPFTKNMAREIISKSDLGKELLSRKSKDLNAKDFEKLRKKITSFS